VATPVLPDAQAQAALDALTQYGTEVKAAEVLKIPRSTFASRVVEARRRGMIPSPHIEDLNNVDHLRARLKRLESELQHAQQHVLNHEIIKQRIIQLGHNVAEIGTPSWILNAPTDHDLPGVPTLFVSDLHWAEVVHPSQINGVNKYNITIARQRMERLALSTVRLLSILSPTMQYPGIVIPLGGDMITGNIHDELTATNEMNSMPAILDLFEVLGIFLSSMADKFGKVFVPCVTGNHGRDTRKIWAKDRHHTSFDWLLYCFLAKHFAQDSRITFLIPDGPDAYFKIYSHRYLMTHGDQFRGGDGMIGALGPIIRGDHKKRSRNAQIDMEYDTMIIGHWHQYIHLTRLIVNGSLKGYDEFAYANNFPFEKPQQALWLTHPKYGITYRMPVFVDRLRKPSKTAWVSVAA
jgi:hypothetical protein